MARIRYLKPDFFKDEDIAELPFWVRILYEGLWAIADKEGRLEDRPKRIKAEVFPHDKVDIEKGLSLLSKKKNGSGRPFIFRYEFEGEKYIQILKWTDHQKPHHTEAASLIPAFNGDITVKQRLNNGEVTVKQPLVNGHVAPNTSELVYKNKDKGNGEGNGEGKCIRHTFDDFWKAYPKPVGQAVALMTFMATVKTEQNFKDLMKALEHYKASEEFKKGFIKTGANWIEDWRGWLLMPPKKSAAHKHFEPVKEIDHKEKEKVAAMVRETAKSMGVKA